MYNQIEKLADAVRNDVVGGLRGYHTNFSLSKEQLMQDIVDERLLVIKEYTLKGLLPVQDLLLSINCIDVQCKNLARCKCSESVCGTPEAWFQIPQILLDWGASKAIKYIGSVDRQHSFLVYTTPIDKINTYRKYRKRGKNKPWVFVDITPNADGMLDCFIFNAPLIKQVSVTAIFKDPRQLEGMDCCNYDHNRLESGGESMANDNFTFLNSIIKDRVTRKKIQYYRSFAPANLPNNQEYAAG